MIFWVIFSVLHREIGVPPAPSDHDVCYFAVVLSGKNYVNIQLV
jgi:hypothetical protein